MRSRLDALAGEGRTLCYSTHNLYEAELLADSLTVIRDGRVVARGPKEDLIAQLEEGATREVVVETDAGAEVFEAAGVDARRDGGAWVVSLPTDLTVGEVVAALVNHGASIEGVREEETSLEELYSELTGGRADA